MVKLKKDKLVNKWIKLKKDKLAFQFIIVVLSSVIGFRKLVMMMKPFKDFTNRLKKMRNKSRT
jgi:hypothetical protein